VTITDTTTAPIRQYRAMLGAQLMWSATLTSDTGSAAEAMVSAATAMTGRPSWAGVVEAVLKTGRPTLAMLMQTAQPARTAGWDALTITTDADGAVCASSSSLEHIDTAHDVAEDGVTRSCGRRISIVSRPGGGWTLTVAGRSPSEVGAALRAAAPGADLPADLARDMDEERAGAREIYTIIPRITRC
jgi:hypothetical protein